jgi:hypothetical protein
VPNSRVNLVSMGTVQRTGYDIIVRMNGRLEMRTGTGEVVAQGRQEYGLLKLHCQVNRQNEKDCAHLVSTPMADLWHLRLGHLHREGLRQISSNEIVTGVDRCTGNQLEVGTGCAPGKLQRKSFKSKRIETRSKVRLPIIHSDRIFLLDIY